MVDGTEDDNIHCFKKGTTCETGRERLTTQLSIIQEETNDVDAFEINADDMEDASQPSHIVNEDVDEDEDDFIDVILC